MSGDLLEFSVGGPRVIVAHQPEATTTTVVATYAQGFGHDPANAPGVAHLHEHLFLSALRATMRDPVVAQAQTHADRTRVTATVLAGAEKALVTALTSAATTLAAGRVDESVLARECRAIDVELSEWFGSPMLIAGHKLAALATRRPQLARFDECRIGDTARLAEVTRRKYAARRHVRCPERLVIVSPQPAQAWHPLVELLNPSMSTVEEHPPTPGSVVLPATPENRVYVGIPLPTATPDNAETTMVAARTLLARNGPLAEIGARAGCRFRGGSMLPGTGHAVVAASWLAEDAGSQTTLDAALRQHDGEAHPEVIAARTASLHKERQATAATQPVLAATIDDWQSGYGLDPTATHLPAVDRVNHALRTGWHQAVLVSAPRTTGEPGTAPQPGPSVRTGRR